MAFAFISSSKLYEELNILIFYLNNSIKYKNKIVTIFEWFNDNFFYNIKIKNLAIIFWSNFDRTIEKVILTNNSIKSYKRHLNKGFDILHSSFLSISYNI